MSLLAYEAYLVGLGFVAVFVSEWFFSLVYGERYLKARAELEYAVHRLQSGGLSRRAASRLVARVNLLRLELRRYIIARLLLLAPVYTLVAVFSLTRLSAYLLPVNCCIPLLAMRMGEACVTTAPLLVAASFLAALPLIQEDLVLVLLLGKRFPRNAGGQGVNH